jgi:hypothetical protein
MEWHFFPAGEENMPGWAQEQCRGNRALWPEGGLPPVEAPVVGEELVIDEDEPSYSLTKPLGEHTAEELRGVAQDLGVSKSGNKPELMSRIAIFLNIPEE